MWTQESVKGARVRLQVFTCKRRYKYLLTFLWSFKNNPTYYKKITYCKIWWERNHPNIWLLLDNTTFPSLPHLCKRWCKQFINIAHDFLPHFNGLSLWNRRSFVDTNMKGFAPCFHKILSSFSWFVLQLFSHHISWNQSFLLGIPIEG